jgi:hypothetical protein
MIFMVILSLAELGDLVGLCVKPARFNATARSEVAKYPQMI